MADGAVDEVAIGISVGCIGGGGYSAALRAALPARQVSGRNRSKDLHLGDMEVIGSAELNADVAGLHIDCDRGRRVGIAV